MAGTGDTGGGTVVIVNGDEALAHALKFRIELEGLTVRIHDDARALLALGMAPEGACLVLDHDMPDVDALQMIRHMRSTGSKTPVVLMATNPNSNLKARAAAAGIDLVEKPLLNDVLLTAVRRALVRKIT